MTMKYRAFEKYIVAISFGFIGLMFLAQPAAAGVADTITEHAQSPQTYAIGLLSTYIAIKILAVRPSSF